MEFMNPRGAARAAAVVAAMVIVTACQSPFTSPSLIQGRRFLAIVADPLESAPGGTVAFQALVVNADGTLFTGPIGWTVVGGDNLRLATGTNPLTSGAVVETPASEPYNWPVPATADLTSRYGAMEKNGLLLTVGALAFEPGNLFQGEPVGASIPAFGLFVVSNGGSSEPMSNPALERIAVLNAAGNELTPDAQGEVQTTDRKAFLHAITDDAGGDLSFAWFSTDSQFAPAEGAFQSFRPAGKGLYRVYCVLRRTYDFVHDDHTSTMITGIDWQTVAIRFE